MDCQSIDIDLALEQLGGSMKLYKTVVKGFNVRYSHVDQTIEQHLNRADLDEARRIAHSIKGLCGNLGALKLREKALDLEQAIKEESEDISKCLQAFSEELVCVNRDIRNILRSRYGISVDSNDGSLSGDLSTEGIYDALLRVLPTYHYSEIQSAVAILQEKDIPAAHKEILNEVYNLIDDFEYEKALEVLRKVFNNG